MSLQVSRTDLYAYGGYRIRHEDGSEDLERRVIDWKPQKTDRFHIVKVGEELDEIAYNYYKDIVEKAERYWFLIADANHIPDPLDIRSYHHQTIRIPDVQLLSLIEAT